MRENRWSAASGTLGYQAHSPGMSPDQELNSKLLVYRLTPNHWARRPGNNMYFYWYQRRRKRWKDQWWESIIVRLLPAHLQGWSPKPDPERTVASRQSKAWTRPNAVATLHREVLPPTHTPTPLGPTGSVWISIRWLLVKGVGTHWLRTASRVS